MPLVQHLHGLRLEPEAWTTIDSVLGLEFNECNEQLEPARACAFEAEPTVGQLLRSQLVRDEKYRALAMGISNVVSEWLSLD